MNKTAIKNFAIWARVQLIESCKQRAYEYGVAEDGKYTPNLKTVGSRILTDQESEQRNQLIDQIRQKGYAQVMEEAAYTWFNRFIALRFMEVNGYLPSKVRVFTDETGAFKPELLKEAMTIELEGKDRSIVIELLEKQDNEGLYKYLLITQCNALSDGLPYMFERILNWTELLFPANLLRNDSVVGRMVSDIPEEDWTDAVQIIGWLYQYYNSELKDETFALLKKNVKITKERIPAATQLFTPDWIVRYMVENSLGRLWYEGHKDFDKTEWKYYLDEAAQEPEVEEQLAKIREEYSKIKPEEIKVIDPCMGSGHILVYAFDVLMQIYTSSGWSERDAARSIIENNLYGLDIDDRAGQLAYFAVMMKARKYSRRIMTLGLQPNLLSIQDSSFMTNELIDFVAGNDTKIRSDLRRVKEVFTDAKEYGSILNVPSLGYETILDRISEIQVNFVEDVFQIEYRDIAVEKLLPLMKQAIIMSQKYDLAVTNPPYMGGRNMNGKLLDKIVTEFPEGKADLYSAFIIKTIDMTKLHGYQAMITMHSWMFLSSFEQLRNKILGNNFIVMNHLGARAFEEISGEVVQTTTWSLRRMTSSKKYTSKFVRLLEYGSQEEKESAYLCGKAPIYCIEQNLLRSIPGSAFGYWLENPNVFSEGTLLEEVANPRQGLKTLDNDYYIKYWYEVPLNKICFAAKKTEDTKASGKKWFPLNHGGEFRKHYGNNYYVVNWENDGSEMKANAVRKYNSITRTITNIAYYFKEGITWSVLCSEPSFRWYGEGFIFSNGGQCIVPDGTVDLYYLMGLLNSKIAGFLLNMLSPTMGFESGYLKKLPIIVSDEDYKIVRELAIENIALSKDEWDDYEISWDFQVHPLITRAQSLRSQYEYWENKAQERFDRVRQNEETLNEIFIRVYGFEKSLKPDVSESSISLRLSDKKRDIRSLISYAVGCMFGRYSLDNPGIACAGGTLDSSKYTTFQPDSDAIIPICDDEYFEDDIVGRFVKFVETVYGKATLEENLLFISEAIGGKGSARDVIRNYFINDFYADHLKVYQKRPIYWLFDSGKKNGFKCLVYMHRYQPDLLARMRTDYVHEQQERYRSQLQMLEESIQNDTPFDRTMINKQIKKLRDQSVEIQKYEEKIHHLADQMITIDLDDGVKVNYAKFKDVLEKIK